MSVLIRGMQMPSGCRGCRLMNYDFSSGKTWCFPAYGILADDYKPIEFEGRPDWCPLVEVKEPHGRLIDEDEIIIPSLTSWADQAMVADAIHDAHTIIEAEGAEE